MSHVQIEALSKTFGSTKVIQELDLEVQDGEFLVLLGPSGCGKTTTLRCLAGLEEPTAGTISLGGETVFDRAARINRSPDKRSIGMVFQSYALWPHMTVRKNIAYPLKARGMKDKIGEGWVEDTARLVDCRAAAGPVSRHSSAAVSSSAWRSPEAWSPGPGWCCSTSR